MPNTSLKFDFEKATLPVGDGTVFRPDAETEARWESARRGRLGIEWQLLYQHNDGRFILVHYIGCAEFEVPEKEGEEPHRIWRGAIAGVELMRPLQALKFVKELKADTTPKLEAAGAEDERAWNENFQRSLRERSRIPKPKPEQHWKENAQDSIYRIMTLTPAHDLELRKVAREAYLSLVELVQALRERREETASRIYGIGSFDDLRNKVFAEFNVDPDQWWGPSDRVPPRRVQICDLNWPRQLNSIPKLLRRIHRVIELPCYCFHALDASDWHDGRGYQKPHNGDILAATQSLIGKLPRLEELVGELGLFLRQQAIVGREGTAAPSEEVVDLAPRLAKALNSYELAENSLEQEDGGRVTDDSAHAWLELNAAPEYDLPDCETWKRYLREARDLTGRKKNLPRAGRRGSSVADAGSS